MAVRRLPGPGRLLAVLLVLVASLTAGCDRRRTRTSGVPRSRVLVVIPEIGSSWARNFNPLLVPGQQLWPAQGGIYEPLLIFNSVKGHYVPWLASAHRWKSGARVLEFDLREGVTWADGEAFTAKDVAFTFELLRKQPAFDSQGVWQHVKRVEVVGPHQVRFHFDRAHVPSLFGIAIQCIVPEHRWRQLKDPLRFTDPDPVGTGPFSKVLHFQSQVYEVGRNPRHWRPGKPAYDAVRVPAFPSNDQGSLAIIRGEVDWAGVFMPAIDRIFVAKDPAHHKYWFPRISGTVMLYANTTRGVLGDKRFRKAISRAIDRPLMVRVAVHGYTRPADGTGLSELYDRWRDPAAVAAGGWTKFDPSRAARELDALGLKRVNGGMRRDGRGRPLRFEVSVVTGWSDWVLAAQIVVRGLRKVGVDAHLRTYDRGAWQERVQKGDFDLCVGWSNTAPTPYRFYRELMAPETVRPVGQAALTNWHRFGHPEAARLLRAFEGAANKATQRKLISALQQLFAEEAPAIPLYPQAAWGEAITRRFVGFPSADNPYARLPPFPAPEFALVLGELRPRSGR